MPTVWQAPPNVRVLVERIKSHHPHLGQASIWVLMSTASAVTCNRFVATRASLCTKTEKLESGHDFKIIISSDAWQKLTDAQREVEIGKALCRCGVRYEPETIEINGKAHVVKDDLGRVIYTDEIAYDKEGRPRWCVNKPDAEIYFSLFKRRGAYDESTDNACRLVRGEPLTQQIPASAPASSDD